MRLILIKKAAAHKDDRDMSTLSDLQPHDSARIIGFSSDCPPAYRRALLTRGLVPQSLITIERVAPLGDPMEINIRQTRLTLRRQEARHILVERL